MTTDPPKNERHFDPAANVGCVTGFRLGDALISMVTAENLRRSGRPVTVYSRPIHGLARWFPKLAIEKIPPEAERRERLSHHDLLVHTFDTDVLPESSDHRGLLVLNHLDAYRRPLKSQVEVHRDLARTLFNVADADIDNGMRPPSDLQASDPTRVMIHPTATRADRMWSPSSFIVVAEGLQSRGFSPEFVTAPSEIESTAWIERSGFPRFAVGELDRVADRLAGSAAFVGNDSGIAHLSSSVGLPFVTVNIRRKLSIRWRPGWTNGETLIPSIPLIINPLKNRFWRNFITVDHVLSAFDRVIGDPRS